MEAFWWFVGGVRRFIWWFVGGVRRFFGGLFGECKEGYLVGVRRFIGGGKEGYLVVYWWDKEAFWRSIWWV